MPIQDWFLGQSGAFALRELTEFCDQTDFLDRSAVMKLIQSGRGTDAWFSVLEFVLWWKQFIAGQSLSLANQIEPLVAAQQF